MHWLPPTKTLLKHLSRPPLTLVRTDSSTICSDADGDIRLQPSQNAQQIRRANLIMLLALP